MPPVMSALTVVAVIAEPKPAHSRMNSRDHVVDVVAAGVDRAAEDEHEHQQDHHRQDDRRQQRVDLPGRAAAGCGRRASASSPPRRAAAPAPRSAGRAVSNAARAGRLEQVLIRPPPAGSRCGTARGTARAGSAAAGSAAGERPGGSVSARNASSSDGELSERSRHARRVRRDDRAGNGSRPHHRRCARSGVRAAGRSGAPASASTAARAASARSRSASARPSAPEWPSGPAPLATSTPRRARRAGAGPAPRSASSGNARCTRSVPTRRFSSVRRALRDQPAAVEDGDPVGELVGLLQVLRGEEDRRPGLGQLPDRRPDPAPARRVQARSSARRGRSPRAAGGR